MIAFTLLALMAGGTQAVAPAQPAPTAFKMFVDVPKGHWAFQAVYDLKRVGVLEGYPNRNSSVKPEALIGIRELGKFNDSAKDVDPEPFKDFDRNH